MLEAIQQLPAPNARHRSPSLLLVALAHVVLFLASLIVSTAMAGGRHFPSPFESSDRSLRFFAENASALRVMALLQFGAAIPLGILAASASSRLQFLGMKVAGVNIALYGGVAASISLMISACAAWVLGQLDIADSAASSVRAVHLFCFAAGGPGYVVPFGLLIAGIAIVGGVQGFLPRWLMVSGIAIAVVAELSFLTFVLPGAAYLLPLARFPGLVWLVVACALLPKMKLSSSLARRAGAGLVLVALTLIAKNGRSEGALTTITVVVNGLRNSNGKAGCAIFASADGFANKPEKAVRRTFVNIANRTATCVFSNVQPGVYAVASMHDENENGKLDATIVGKPTEGVGASRDARPGFMRGPRFDDAALRFSAGSFTVPITIRYL